MMEKDKFLYSASDIAELMMELEFGARKRMYFLDHIWKSENKYLKKIYKNNKKRFILDVNFLINCKIDKNTFIEELTMVKEDIKINQEEISYKLQTQNYFFKRARIKLLYTDTNCVRIKLRNLLKFYGYKRRNKVITEHIKKCIRFYRLKPFLKAKKICDIEKIKLDEMIIFYPKEEISREF